ncbi:MAG TPA: hypothetical protein VD994_14410 [Prosthecobacter sp.]|nr:hypothetical protein [Prosthecobacter sp.]
MSAYTKPIIRLGLITPAIFNCLLLAGVLASVSKLAKVRAEKQAMYEEETDRLNEIKMLESAIKPNRGVFADQKKILESDPGQIFTKLVELQLPKYKEIELERSGLVFPLERGKIASQVKADAARVKSIFQGGLGPMQETLLQVESLMPQAVLEEMKISRKTDSLMNQREFLVLEMTHTCWKSGEDDKR